MEENLEWICLLHECDLIFFVVIAVNNAIVNWNARGPLTEWNGNYSSEIRTNRRSANVCGQICIIFLFYYFFCRWR